MRLWNYLENGGKRAVEVAHRRWGKDEVALHWTAVAAHEKVGTYWHMLPEAAQARKAIWEAVNPHTGKRRIDEAFPSSLRASTRENEMFIRFKNGSTWQVVGSDNFNSLVGSPPVGLVFSEYAIANPAAWSYLRPILLENGGWALFIYTSRGNNHGKALIDTAKTSKGWLGEISPVSLTKAVDAEALAEDFEAMVKEMGATQAKALYNQEWECSFDSAVVGSYYGADLEQARLDRRICAVAYDPAVPVNTAWDLGLDDATAVWFYQLVGKEIHLIKYREWTQQALTDICREVLNEPYGFGEHVFPHDIEARELTTGRSRIEVVRNIMGNVKVAPRTEVADGINAVRTLFPRMWFDEKGCAQGLECLRNYRKAWDEKRKVFQDRPFHDWSSHGSDAARYLALTYREQRGLSQERVRSKPRRHSAWAA